MSCTPKRLKEIIGRGSHIAISRKKERKKERRKERKIKGHIAISVTNSTTGVYPRLKTTFLSLRLRLRNGKGEGRERGRGREGQILIRIGFCTNRCTNLCF